uniref:Uncharacterized protein n=1 Tax=Amphimedon queenslandica TaxID=400682 RepID=A0A1X7TP29_AMPQE
MSLSMSLPPPTGDSMKSIEGKVVILGAQGVGKTSLVVRNMGGVFSDNISPTIGAAFFSLQVTLAGYRVKLQVWDTAGQEKYFPTMAPMYYRKANAAVIVYDVNNEKSFQEAKEWVKEVKSRIDFPMSISVVANKIDLSDSNRQVTMNRGVTFAHSLGAMFTETSAAQNIGVKEAFLKVAQGIIEIYNCNSHAARPESIRPLSDTVLLSSPTANNSHHTTYLYQTTSIDNEECKPEEDAQSKSKCFC